MTEPASPGMTEERLESLSRLVMRKQAGLSLRIASAFLVMILALPLVNYSIPEYASYPIYGVPASWLFLAVLFYPITVALSVIFVRRSDRIEAACMDLVKGGDLS